jgi:hypothetical protein
VPNKKPAFGEEQTMKLGFFTMPIHPVDKDWRLSLKEDREAFLLADELGFTEAYVGEHVTDRAENITSCIAFIAWLAAATRQIKLGTGTVNMPNGHPAARGGQECHVPGGDQSGAPDLGGRAAL